MGIISEFWFIPEYWHPIYLLDIAVGGWRFGLEDFLITFAVAGIAAGIFEGLALRRGFAELPRVSRRTLLRMIGWGVVGLFLMVLLASGLDMNSMHAVLLIVMILSLLMLFGRWKIFPLVIPIAVIFGLLYWLFCVVFFLPIFPGVIQAFWNLENTWGIMLAGVPIEEPLWAFTTALFTGPVFRVSATRSS
ncbi:MAG: lycopene cyclase domain-containing protein [Dehalococcoidia bacterium]